MKFTAWQTRSAILHTIHLPLAVDSIRLPKHTITTWLHGAANSMTHSHTDMMRSSHWAEARTKQGRAGRRCSLYRSLSAATSTTHLSRRFARSVRPKPKASPLAGSGRLDSTLIRSRVTSHQSRSRLDELPASLFWSFLGGPKKLFSSKSRKHSTASPHGRRKRKNGC